MGVGGCCCEGSCEKYNGVLWGLLGALMLFNLVVWPKWTGIDGWMGFFGLVMLVGGVWKSFLVGCKGKLLEAPKETHEVHVEHPAAPAPVHKEAKKKR